MSPSTPQLPFKRPYIPSSGDRKALNRGTLGGLGLCYGSDQNPVPFLNALPMWEQFFMPTSQICVVHGGEALVSAHV